MDYTNFKETFIEALQQEFEDRGVDVNMNANPVSKLNNEGYDGVAVTPAGSNVGVTLNIELFHEAYENGTPMSAIVNRAADVAENAFENRPEIDLKALTDYEQMKDKLVMEVVSTEGNEEMLAKVPHKEMEDMSVVYRFVLETNESGRSTILVTHSLIESMGVTPEQLHEDAMKNAPELKPMVITGMAQAMAEMMGMSQEEIAMMGMPTDPVEEAMFIATVSDKINGAGVIAYQNFMEQAADRVGGSFFILPSSLHEVLLVRDNGDFTLESLQEMVRDVNATQVAPEDKLTDSVYHYDAKDKIFELGEKFVAREAAKEAAEKSSVLGDLKAKKEEVAKQPKKDAVEKAANKNKGGDAI